MGLHRHVTLTTVAEENEDIITWAKQNNLDEVYDLFSYDCIEECNWYTIEEDLNSLTNEFPEKKFMVEIEEGSGERWRFYGFMGELFFVDSHIVWDTAPFELT